MGGDRVRLRGISARHASRLCRACARIEISREAGCQNRRKVSCRQAFLLERGYVLLARRCIASGAAPASAEDSDDSGFPTPLLRPAIPKQAPRGVSAV